MSWLNTSSPGNTNFRPSSTGAGADPGSSSARLSSNYATCGERNERSAGDDDEPRVGFHSHAVGGGVPKDREKYLTAKYPKHTMGLIRRRLTVEDWIDQQMKVLYNVVGDGYDADIDLDEILDMDDDSEKIMYIREQLINAPQSPSTIDNFIRELLDKARQL